MTIFRRTFGCFHFIQKKTSTTEKLSGAKGNTFPNSLPPSLYNALEILVCLLNAQYLSRDHLENDFSYRQSGGICETLPLNHLHTLLYYPGRGEAFLEQTIHVLSTANNAHVKWMTASSRKLSAETNKSAACSFQSEVRRCNPS